MEVTFDVIKPNLYTVKGGHKDSEEVFFALDDLSELVSASQHIDTVTKELVGELKVRGGDIEMLRGEKPSKFEERYTVPLSEYLAVMSGQGKILPMASREGNFFGLRELIFACTGENLEAAAMYADLKRFLGNFDKAVEQWETNVAVVLDKESSRKKLTARLAELESKVIRPTVSYHVEEGVMPTHPLLLNVFPVGRISIYGEEHPEKVKKLVSSLVEGLKRFDGPKLSLDASTYMHHSKTLQLDAGNLIQRYGDILRGSADWRSRLLLVG